VPAYHDHDHDRDRRSGDGGRDDDWDSDWDWDRDQQHHRDHSELNAQLFADVEHLEDGAYPESESGLGRQLPNSARTLDGSGEHDPDGPLLANGESDEGIDGGSN